MALSELVLGAWVAQAVHAAAELGIAALADGPVSVEELSRRVEADPDALERLLRALITRGVSAASRRALRPESAGGDVAFRWIGVAAWRGSVVWFAAAPGAFELVGGFGEDRATQRPDIAWPPDRRSRDLARRVSLPTTSVATRRSWTWEADTVDLDVGPGPATAPLTGAPPGPHQPAPRRSKTPHFARPIDPRHSTTPPPTLDKCSSY